jgi:hypothetical protein
MLGGLRKPENMTTRKFCNCLTELNTYLALFPNDRFDEEGVPAGFSEDQKIHEHLLVNVNYFSLPKTWLTTMTTHGFDYAERDDPKGDLIKFCEERIEVLKHEQPAAKKARAEARGAAKATLKSPPSASKGNSKGTTNTKRKFDSECKVIQAQIQSLKEQRAKAKPPMECTELQKMFNTLLSQYLVALLPRPQEKKRRQVTWTDAPAWTWSHVKGHQDTTKSVDNLDLLSQLNIRMDAKAKEFWSATNGKTSTTNLILEPWPTFIEAKKLTSNLREALREHCPSENTLNYWQKKRQFQSSSVRDIDWDAFGAAMQAVPPGMQRWVTKIEHVWKCKQDTDMIWNKSLTLVQEWLGEWHTPRNVQANYNRIITVAIR